MIADTKEALAKNGRENDIATFDFTLNCDYGELVVHHALEAGAMENDQTLSTHPAEAIDQLGDWQRAGFNHVTIRFPDRDLSAFRDKLERFHEQVMKPLGAAVSA